MVKKRREYIVFYKFIYIYGHNSITINDPKADTQAGEYIKNTARYLPINLPITANLAIAWHSSNNNSSMFTM